MKPTKEELERMYVHQGMSTTQIAVKCKVTHNAVFNWMKEFKIIARDHSSSMKAYHDHKKRPTREELERMRIYQKMRIDEIAKFYDVSGHTIYNWLSKRGIEKRKYGIWKNLEFTLEQAKQFLKQHTQYDELPGDVILSREGNCSLSFAITKYHGGFPSFREKLREYMGRQNVSESPSLLEQYAGGEK